MSLQTLLCSYIIIRISNPDTTVAYRIHRRTMRKRTGRLSGLGWDAILRQYTRTLAPVKPGSRVSWRTKLSIACEQALIRRPRRRVLGGEAVTYSTVLGIAARDGDAGSEACTVQVLSSHATAAFRRGYCGYVFESGDLPLEFERWLVSSGVPCITGVGSADGIISGDIVELNSPAGQVRLIDFADSGDKTLLLTNRCNSNCVMCPDPEGIRRRGRDAPLAWIDRYLSLLDCDTRHLTITGGEPTILGEGLFEVLDMCFRYLPRAGFLLLSNARMFCYPEYVRRFAAHIQGRIVVAAALHGATPAEHDHATRADGSFKQTLQGIQNLMGHGISVEVRVVLQKANWHRLKDLAELIAAKTPGTIQVNFMGLELLGNAARNLGEVWIDYREVAAELSQAITLLAQHGIPSRIYNLPLCVVDPTYWSLCAKSISDYKRTYTPECSRCTVLDHCGGLFGTTLNHRLTEVRPVGQMGMAR
jgi:His-Xaa-Ser system radical SAM maturase HxsC